VRDIKKDKVLAMIVVMKTILEVLEGGTFEDEKDYEVFKDYFTDAGFDIKLLADESLINVLQLVCKIFGELNLEEYWVDGDELTEAD
jgi:hypothetical protein